MIGIPTGEVYIYEDDVFARLSAAYRAGGRAELVAVYAEMRVKESTRNRYQYVVSRLHDQEHLPDSGRAPGGNAE